MARRRYGSNPHVPSFAAALRNPLAVVMPGVVGIGAAVGVVTVGNYIRRSFLSTINFGGETGNIVINAVVRGGVAYAGDRFLPLGQHRGAFRIGAAVGIIGSAVLEFMGTSFVIGAGDSSQTPQSIFSGLSGIGAYQRALAGRGGVGAYQRSGINLRGVNGAPGVPGVGRGPSGADRIYSAGM